MADLRCPFCGVPIPDTGMRSWSGSGPPDGALPDVPEAAWRQNSACPSCGKALVRNPGAATESLTEWRPARPLLQFGGTAIMRSTDPPRGDGPVTHYGSAHLSGSGTLTATGVASGTVLPEEVRINRVAWDIGTTGFGAYIGSEVMGHAGAVIGGAAAFVWSRRRWSKG